MTEEKFVNLHTHSHYSLLDGLSSPKTLVAEAVRLGYKSLALTDHGTCGGLYNFQKECLSNGIKPILGMETYIAEDMSYKEKDATHAHLILLAKNTIGYKNLIYLSSKAYIDGFYRRPRIDFDLLAEHKEGLIVTSACQAGEIPRLLLAGEYDAAVQRVKKYKDLMGDDFYLEIMSHKYFDKRKDFEDQEKDLAKLTYRLSKETGVKAFCSQDVHYATKSDSFTQDVLLCIQTHNCIKNENRFSFDSDDFYMKTIEEMCIQYQKAPELLANSVEISDKIETGENGLIVPNDDLLPDYDVPEGFDTPDDFLKSIVREGMEKRGLIDKPEYRKRIKYEMSVIVKCGYVRYFLILWDIINYCNETGIRVGIGRGSAVSSLVLYVCGITKLDPLKYDLIFERFLNPERISPPDVDVDFDYYKRQDVYDYIVNKYGQDHCTQIGTYGSYKAKAAVRGVVKAMDLGDDWGASFEADKKKNPNLKKPLTKNSLDLSDRISKLIPNTPGITLDDAMRDDKLFRNIVLKYPGFKDCLLRMEGTLSNGGIHAAGILVCKEPIISQVPLRTNKGVVCSQYDGPEVEELGLLKYDILAIKTLTVVDRTVIMVKERRGIEVDVDLLEPDNKKVFKIFNGQGPIDTRGIFQFESHGMQELLKNIRVDSFDDLIVANALYRPGTLKAGVQHLFCDYKHGRKEIEYIHPKMGEVLKDTYGIMVYQESVMKVAQHLANFTGGQADTLRKAMGKKKPELLKQQKELFVTGCAKNDISREIAEKVFQQIDYFSGYGFNKSHSAAYAFLAYQTAYLKVMYPMEYMCNLLTSEIDNGDKNLKLNSYLKQSKAMGIACINPDVNRSGVEFSIEKGKNKKGEEYEFLRSPLTILPGIGRKAVQSIADNQPYDGIEDFIMRVENRLVNSRVFNTLCEYKCMTSWGVTSERLLEIYPEIKKRVDKEKKAVKKQQEKDDEFEGSLFDSFDYSAEDVSV